MMICFAASLIVDLPDFKACFRCRVARLTGRSLLMADFEGFLVSSVIKAFLVFLLRPITAAEASTTAFSAVRSCDETEKCLAFRACFLRGVAESTIFSMAVANFSGVPGSLIVL